MLNIGDKANSTAGSTGELTAEEYNDHKNELQKAITATSQALSGSQTPLQLSRALFVNGTGAQRVIDTASDDSIVLSPLTGADGLQVPDTLAPLSGCVLSFNKVTVNVTTAVTVNLGQTGTELGAKELVRTDGSVPEIGDVIGECLVRYDLSLDKWVLLKNGGGSFTIPAVDTDAIDPVFENNQIVGDVTLGDAVITLNAPVFLGQKVHIKADGSGVLEVNGGNGVYASSIFVTENTGGARAEAVSDGSGGFLWSFANEATADYSAGGWGIIKTTFGVATLSAVSGTKSITTSVGAIYRSSIITTVFPLLFQNNPLNVLGAARFTISGDIWFGTIQSVSTSDISNYLFASSSTTGVQTLIVEGSYA